MATIRQQKLAQAIVENLDAVEPLNRQEMLESVGYAGSVATGKPKEIFDSKGLKEALFKLGFDSNNAKRVVGEILNDDTAENKDRLKAAELTFKVGGDYAPEKTLNVNVEVTNDPVVSELTNRLNELYRSTQGESIQVQQEV